MGLTRVSLLRPVAITMFFLMLVAMGAMAYTRLPVDRFPNLSFPFIRVAVSYPGASPEDVEALVTRPIEDAVVGVNGIDAITSTSIEGNSSVSIRFVEGTDVNAAAIDIERKINQVRNQLPPDAGNPSIFKADPSAFPIMNVAVSSDRLDLQDLYNLVVNEVQPRVQAVNGVADVSVVGGLRREINVRVDTRKLQSYGLSLQQVNSALANENVSLPGGPVRTAERVVNTRTEALAQTPAELEQIVIAQTPNGVVRLSDVAQVIDTHAFQSTRLRLNGNEAVGLVITKQSGVNSIQVADDIRRTLADLQTSLGARSGVRFDVVNDQAIFTRAAVDDVQRSLGLAVLLTALVLLLFLHTLRNTFIVLVAIPTSLVSTFFVMFLLGFNLDTMSLMALALLIGILVDDSIVVLENINRHLGLGESPWDAALNGRSEIGMAAIAITLTDVVVFLPIAFISGNVGQLFREFGITIVAATLCSLLVSFTLTPMLASRLLKEDTLEHITGTGPWAEFTRAWERAFHRLTRAYRRLLSGALRLRGAVVLSGFLALAVVISFIPLHLLGTEFSPQEDDNVFNVSVELPVGTPVEVTSATMQQIEEQLLHIPEVQSIFSTVGSGGFAGQQERFGQITVGLVDKTRRSRSVFDIVRQVRGLSARFPNALIRTGVPSPLAGGGGAPVQVVIRGSDLNRLEELANQVQDIMKRTPGVVEPRSTSFVPSPEFRAVVDRAKAADLGLNAETIATTLRAAVQGQVVSELRPEGQDQVDIRVLLQDAEHLTADQLAAIPLLTSKGALVRLDQVAKVVPASSPGQISRYNRAREVEVQANVSGRALGDVLRDIQAQTSQIPLPAGYTIQIAGQGQQLDVAFQALAQALALSIVLMYMLMAGLYESLIYPLAVLFCLPVALVGAFLGLLVVGDTVNIFSLIGMIMLVGLVAKNAILLVDYTNTLRKRGLSRQEALLQAGPTRLRPILMTTATLVFSMIPLALKIGDGAEARSPLAIVILGGMITSTLLTLVLVPCAYTYLDDLQGLLLRRRARLQPALVAPPAIAGGSQQ